MLRANIGRTQKDLSDFKLGITRHFIKGQLGVLLLK
jgi:hypothetical protein